jgi:hypothetical protein
MGPKIFQLLVFSLISFSHAPEYPIIGAISNFYVNWQIYSKVNVITDVNDTGKQWEKFLRQEVFSYFCWDAVWLLEGRLIVSQMLHRRCQWHLDILLPVSFLPGINYHWCRCRGKIITGVVVTGDNFCCQNRWKSGTKHTCENLESDFL